MRVAIGGYLTGGAIWHSQSGESIFAHIPGLLVAFPSRTRDAVGLLRTAFAARGPGALPRAQAPLPPALRGRPVPARRTGCSPSAAAPWPGRDATSPSSPGAPRCRSRWWPPSELAAEGCSVEVVDLRTIAPWDQRPRVRVGASAPSRLLVVHEDTLTAGFGAEVAAWVAEHCFWDLDAPVARVAATDTFVAYEPSLEHAILPQVDDIVAAARALAASERAQRPADGRAGTRRAILTAWTAWW